MPVRHHSYKYAKGGGREAEARSARAPIPQTVRAEAAETEAKRARRASGGVLGAIKGNIDSLRRSVIPTLRGGAPP